MFEFELFKALNNQTIKPIKKGFFFIFDQNFFFKPNPSNLWTGQSQITLYKQIQIDEKMENCLESPDFTAIGNAFCK